MDSRETSPSPRRKLDLLPSVYVAFRLQSKERDDTRGQRSELTLYEDEPTIFFDLTINSGCRVSYMPPGLRKSGLETSTRYEMHQED